MKPAYRAFCRLLFLGGVGVIVLLAFQEQGAKTRLKPTYTAGEEQQHHAQEDWSDTGFPIAIHFEYLIPAACAYALGLFVPALRVRPRPPRPDAPFK